MQSCTSNYTGIFARGWKAIIVKIPRKDFKCDNLRSIYVLPTVVEILTKIILEHMKDHFENLINREKICFCFGSFCTDPTSCLHFITRSWYLSSNTSTTLITSASYFIIITDNKEILQEPKSPRNIWELPRSLSTVQELSPMVRSSERNSFCKLN